MVVLVALPLAALLAVTATVAVGRLNRAAAASDVVHAMTVANAVRGVLAQLEAEEVTSVGFLVSVPLWVKVICATTISAGIATGGFRIIRTVGKRLTKLLPVHGFAAQATGAAIIQTATLVGVPLSTTHVISSCVMGVGAAKRLTAVKWSLMGKIAWAWIITLPITASLGYTLFCALRLPSVVPPGAQHPAALIRAHSDPARVSSGSVPDRDTMKWKF